MIAFYNEIDDFACGWLSNLMDAGLITPGYISNESIEDIVPSELVGYDRVHFFAGIGGWDYALNLAGWGARPVWTGSCPCQPFSAAGKGAGTADERHLWPSFFHLIEQCRPVWVFGEQVASSDALSWLDLVCSDLEGTGYAARALDMCAAGFGAPHIRQRLYWVAHNHAQQRHGFGHIGAGRRSEFADRLEPCRMDDGQQQGLERFRGGYQAEIGRKQRRSESIERSLIGRCGENELDAGRRPSATNGAWRDADWLFCRDGKWRPVEASTFPLAHGVSNRMGLLRGYGNAIVPQEAAEFIKAVIHEI